MAEANDTINLTKIKLSLGQSVFIIGLALAASGAFATSLMQLKRVTDLVEKHETRISRLEVNEEASRAYERGRKDGLNTPGR